jgi:hypothetical protein
MGGKTKLWVGRFEGFRRKVEGALGSETFRSPLDFCYVLLQWHSRQKRSDKEKKNPALAQNILRES